LKVGKDWRFVVIPQYNLPPKNPTKRVKKQKRESVQLLPKRHKKEKKQSVERELRKYERGK